MVKSVVSYLFFTFLLFHLYLLRFRDTVEGRRIGTLCGAGTRLISSGTVDIVFCLNRVATLAHHVEVIAGGIVLRSTVVAIAVATQLAYGFHAGSTLVDDLHEVVVTVGIDGDAYLHTGTDIVGGMTQGLTRKRAAEFSFFLAVPTMAGATLLDLLDLLKEDAAWATSHNVAMLLLGCVVAFIVALLAMKWFVAFLTKYGFKAFGIYRIIVGSIIIVLLLTGHSLAMVD